jgi:RNA polymerase sigma-70 factor, ECF subfamily
MVLPVAQQQASITADSIVPSAGLAPGLLRELWTAAEAETCGLSLDEFGIVLAAVGAKHNHGMPPGSVSSRTPDAATQAAFFRALHLPELALAQGCALGKELAWERFVRDYRGFMQQTAIAVTASGSLGQELADSLYAELFGLRAPDGQRRSPFASYSGRGSLRGWLRTTLVQRSMDHHRRTQRETPIDEIDCPAPEPAQPLPAELSVLTAAVARTLGNLGAEDRFLLSAYFLDRQTLLQIARTLCVHEATISRRLKRLVTDLRKQLLENLARDGLSRRAAEEALGTDPRDLEINLRSLLQTSQIAPFSEQKASASTEAQDPR